MSVPLDISNSHVKFKYIICIFKKSAGKSLDLFIIGIFFHVVHYM